eukprot:jgi/Mesen1/8275/ME000448S07418
MESNAPSQSEGRSKIRKSIDGGHSEAQRQRVKTEVCAEVLNRLKEAGSEAVLQPGFQEELQVHFNRLPTRYALDVNTERAEDVLTHKKLLGLALIPENRPVFHVRPVHVLPQSPEANDGSPAESPVGSPDSGGVLGGNRPNRHSYPPPAFGSSPNLEALALDMANSSKAVAVDDDKDSAQSSSHVPSTSPRYPHLPMHEVTFSTIDKPKLLSQGHGFRGTYCGQDVAIKILKPERLNDSLQQEFAQEVFIMRKVRHKNVVQFIGACTKPPNLSIVTEFMSGGSVYDYLHKQRATMKLPMLLKAACDVAKGMDYLHQNQIIHRDLKAANLLMDENDLPYSDLTPLQAAVSVVQKGLRPTIPRGTHPKLVALMERTWKTNPAERPEFSEMVRLLQDTLKEVEEEGEVEQKRKEKKAGGFFSALKRGSK